MNVGENLRNIQHRAQSLELIEQIKEKFPHWNDKFFLSEELGYFIGDVMDRLSWKSPALHQEVMDLLIERTNRIAGHPPMREEYATAN